MDKAENQRFKFLSRSSEYNRYGVGCVRGRESSYIGRNFSFNLYTTNREICRFFFNNIKQINRRMEKNTTNGNYETNQKKQKKQGDNRRRMRVQRSLKGLLFVRAWTLVCPSCKNEALKLRDGNRSPRTGKITLTTRRYWRKLTFHVANTILCWSMLPIFRLFFFYSLTLLFQFSPLSSSVNASVPFDCVWHKLHEQGTVLES